MKKLKIISLVIVMIGFMFTSSTYATNVPPTHRSHQTVKKGFKESGHRYKPHHRIKAHHKKHRGQNKHSFLHKR